MVQSGSKQRLLKTITILELVWRHWDSPGVTASDLVRVKEIKYRNEGGTRIILRDEQVT
jgi:hypothetical protein